MYLSPRYLPDKHASTRNLPQADSSA